jgi:hypothetical protein
MLVINQPGAAVMTTTEAKRDLPGALRVAEKMRVYVTKDGQPIGGLVSMEMMSLLEQALFERAERMARRQNVSVRVVRRAAEPQADNTYLSPAEGVALVGTLSSSVHAMREAARDAAR